MAKSTGRMEPCSQGDCWISNQPANKERAFYTRVMSAFLTVRPDPSVVTAPIADQKSLLVMTQQSHGAARWLYALAVCCSRSPRSLLLAVAVQEVQEVYSVRIALQPVSEGVASQSFAMH